EPEHFDADVQRPRSAPAEDLFEFADEAWAQRERSHYPYVGALPPRSPSMIEGRSLLLHSGALAQAAALEADRRSPPPTQVHGMLTKSPHSQSPFSSPALHGRGNMQYTDEGPALLHPGAKRAYDGPFNRPISAPPAPEGEQQADLTGDFRGGLGAPAKYKDSFPGTLAFVHQGGYQTVWQASDEP
ncbi:unnamed protein product, partial [Effrenium voratum]